MCCVDGGCNIGADGVKAEQKERNAEQQISRSVEIASKFHELNSNPASTPPEWRSTRRSTVSVDYCWSPADSHSKIVAGAVVAVDRKQRFEHFARARIKDRARTAVGTAHIESVPMAADPVWSGALGYQCHVGKR